MPLGNLTYRNATQEDAEFLYMLHRATLRDYVVQTWGEWDEDWQQTRFREAFCPERSQIIVVGGCDVGVLRLERGSHEWLLHVLEILPHWQRRGIGTRVLQSVLAGAAECQKPVALQVLQANPAKLLYERLGFRKVGETATHIEMRAWPARVAEGSRAEVVEKVVAYITRNSQLLVFQHTKHPEAGIQVPAGTLEQGEISAEAVLREAYEETGLTALRVVRFLGTREHDVHVLGRPQRQHRHFFHLETDEACPLTWLHWEMSPSDETAPVEFRLYWVPLCEALRHVSGELGEMLPLLLKQLGGAATHVG